MDEREALKRQIELLQNLINEHKSVHGDTPFVRDELWQPEAPTSAVGRGHGAPVVHPHSSRGGLYAPQSRGSWRKTYSLSNKNPQLSVGRPSASTSSTVHQSSSHSVSHSASLPSHSRGEEGQKILTAILSSGIPQQKEERHINSTTVEVATEKKPTDTLRKTGAAVSRHEVGRRESRSTSTSEQHETMHRQTQDLQQRTESRRAVLPEKQVVSSLEVPIKPTKTCKTSSIETKPTITKTIPAVPNANAIPPLAALPDVSKHSIEPTSHTSKGQVNASFLKKSKFTWIKSQNVRGVGPKQASSISPTSVSKAGVASGSSPSFTAKRTPGKKLPRKLSSLNVSPKTSKYRWVSISAGAQAKTPRKSISPKALALSQRALEKGEVNKKLRAEDKMKKGVAGSSANSSLISRYCWKAGGQSSSGAAPGGATVARRRSAFHWTSERSNKGVKGGLAASPSGTQRFQRTHLMPSSSPSGFKLRSRMKIIRKSPTGGSGSEMKYSPRARMHSSSRSPVGVKRTPTRELVSFGRHKLRRLSPTSSRTSPASSSHRSPASPRVFRSRYKMVTRPGSSPAAHTVHYNPALSWRAKRIQSARSFLQSRMRAPHDRHPSPAQHWRGSSMCWIRGSLYRVSANKLSRTVASSMSINRTGRSFSPSQVSSTSPAFNGPFSPRHLASRAVQRSLAIIRQAHQKKQQKQYCMYYNRFGKCNRGNSCPYIHDPDKVAVCTRFLRGTCKQADGTCPFSHKVAKEKMPVCSYFLKGICNNSDCPYSHVYVSRKAEVCEDFVKGYCPEGEKCKKKHTLVCPDFSKTGSCPRGARCKLQHRQRAKRGASTPAKRGRTKEPAKRPRLTVAMLPASPGTPTKGPLALPSFISLSSSPEEADAPEPLLAESSQVKEKKLQIKPRL
ncbi:zinc finger CCCH domain-containing protein 3 [Cyclopterus lumpus]|uniref:Zinc finger CCCH domain-containing protein 3 n=1 Tax=Cyclopterus lumpus TaxID=8103 RepID=A0A8C2WX58_CYCLU|nr:zinc finger CCCH domain-containing protein 3 [Cyclopterus lumpus]